MRWLIDTLAIEHRGSRAYDEQDPSHLRHPNGSLIASYDRGFCGAAGRAVLDLFDLYDLYRQKEIAA